MESYPENKILKLPSNGIQEIRKIHNLDKPGRVDEAIDILVKWLQKQNHILKKDFDRDYLERTIIVCKGSVEKAKKQIDSLCTMKTLLPQFFQITNVKAEINNMLDILWLLPLPAVTEDYYRIIVVKVNTKEFTAKRYTAYFQYLFILSEYLKAHDYINGFIIIYDLDQTDVFELVTRMNTVQFQQAMVVLIEGYGARMKGIHFISQSKVLDLLVKTIKPFLPHKMGSRMHVHKTIDEVYDVVPKEVLPKEYGGKEKSINELREDWVNELSSKENVEYMKMMNKACTDESLRATDKFNEEYMGMPGSFRKLNVD